MIRFWNVETVKNPALKSEKADQPRLAAPQS
jgi:hypothetical protein